MKLKNLYQMIVKKGIDADIRSREEIESLLKKRKKSWDRLTKKEKEYFDPDTLFNPFEDSRILNGNPDENIKSMIVGVDVDSGELACVEALKRKGKKIDLVVAHHPQGKAYAKFYEVMDLQVDIFTAQGVAVSVSENLLKERKAQVARRVHAANHTRSVDTARLLGMSFLCMHTPCDNLAFEHLDKKLFKAKPSSLGEIMDILLDIPEYADAAKHNNAPMIAVGSRSSRCKKIHLEFTGGTEGPQKIYKKLASCGVDTIIAMHQSEEHYKCCREQNINVILASHIASDNLGINIMLDYLSAKEKFKIYEFSGFRRFQRKK